MYENGMLPKKAHILTKKKANVLGKWSVVDNKPAVLTGKGL